MEPTYNSKLLCMRLYVHLYANQSTPRLAKSRKRMRPSGTRADSPTLSFLSIDRTDLSKYGLVEQIHTPCDHQGDPRCVSLLSWYLLLNQVIEFLNLLQETIFNGEVAHWVCSITGLDIKREGESTRTLVNTGLYAAWSTRQYACCSLQYLTKKKKTPCAYFTLVHRSRSMSENALILNFPFVGFTAVMNSCICVAQLTGMSEHQEHRKMMHICCSMGNCWGHHVFIHEL